jgi:N-acetyl-gamma-glutamyl-phosphate reductase
VIPAVRGADRGLTFSDSDPAALAKSDLDLFFLALPHGAAAVYAKALVAAGKRVIDLSADFRIADLATYTKYYGEHHAPELIASARFVLPELTPRLETGGQARGRAGLLSDQHPRATRATAEGGCDFA